MCPPSPRDPPQVTSFLSCNQNNVRSACNYTAALQALQLAKTRNKFWVRHWAGTDITPRKLDMPPTYTEFRSRLFLLYSFPTHGKVYYFPNNVLNIAQRVALDNDVSFNIFMALPHSNRLLLYLWKQGQDESPKKEPADEADSQSQISGVSSLSGRSMQKDWAIVIKDLDGWKCVVCQNAIEKHLEAAHIVPANSSKAELKEIGLPSAYEAYNGVTLCRECYSYFDTGFFYFDIDGKLVVSAALVAHVPEWKARQGTSVHRTAERARARNWPEPPMIEWRRKDCAKQQAARITSPTTAKSATKGTNSRRSATSTRKAAGKTCP